jgi:two-component system chemotaxis response regulator CheB
VTDNRIKVLVADDSPLVREILKDMISGERDLQLVGEAVNGREAVILTQRLRPDIITMDVMMPVMNGLEAVEEIMAYTPTPILIFSSVLDDKEMDVAFNAIARGALDVMEKPKVPGERQFDRIRAELLGKLRLLARIRVISHLRGKHKPAPARAAAESAPPPENRRAEGRPRERLKPEPAEGEESSEFPPLPLPSGRVKRRLVAVGASTGGPKALVQIFRRIPRAFPVPVLTVQHIAPSFAPGLVAWLNRESPLTVVLAKDKSTPEPGMVYIAPTGVHIILERGLIRFSDGAPVHSCRPAVDVLFQSVAAGVGEQAVGVLLTGMGHDGAQGLKAIHDRRGFTLVQDEKTSVIFGMPKSAIDLGAADEVVSLPEMPAAILRAIVN